VTPTEFDVILLDDLINLFEFSGRDTDDYQRYRYYVLFRLKDLRFLDSSSVTEDGVNNFIFLPC
jgi:hypothetical protein